ncbi:MAG TPA: glutamate cyclase domain-containing protein, partial [Planctomycetaceae bacterium]|nr:glutamate cyclase domain-containing protein [Planctomycetaceae bacterium]
FFIPGAEPPAAETDGPPGALVLAEALRLSGIDTTVITDGYCWNALAAAARALKFPQERLVRYPHPAGVSPVRATEVATTGLREEGASGALNNAGPVAHPHHVPFTDFTGWRRQFLSLEGGLTHLIAVERVGPNHTLESLVRQPRTGEPPVAQFERLVPIAARDHCHNMRGEVIDRFAGDMHLLFEEVRQYCPGAKTIGVGDGANEIGMGSVPWEELQCRLTGEQSGRVPCRVPCDWNIVAGTSNWGASALAASVLYLRGQGDQLAPFTAQQQQRVLDEMVARGPAVDGVTRRHEATVDGIPFATYIQPWEGIRRVLGLGD